MDNRRTSRRPDWRSAALRLSRRSWPGVSLAVLLLVAPASGAVLRFRSTAQVSTGVVRVGDIAEVSDADPQMVEKIQKVTLVPSPPAGRSLRVDYELVRSRLTAVGIDVTAVQFTGRSLVLVTGAVVEKPVVRAEREPAGINDAIRDTAIRRVSEAINDYVVKKDPTLGQVSVDLSLSAEQVALLSKPATRLDVSEGQEPWIGEQRFAIQVRGAKGTGLTTQVGCRVSPLARAVHVTRVIRAGQVISSQDVVLAAATEESGAGHVLLDDVADVVGMEAQRTLRPGAPLVRDDVRKVILVHRGNPVTILSRVGAITVSMVGKAEGDGTMGDAVIVSTLDRKQKFSAWVTGYHEVSVSEPGGTE